MKKAFLIIGFLVLLPMFAWAQVHVTCNDYLPTVVQPDNFKVNLDGVLSNSTPGAGEVSGVRLWFDVTNVSVGTHHMDVQACKTYVSDPWNLGGEACSAVVPFDFTRPVVGEAPGSPANTHLEPGTTTTTSTSSTSPGSLSAPTGMRSSEEDTLSPRSGTKSLTLPQKK